MYKEANRQKTFLHQNWIYQLLNTELMAASGLYYLGVSDKVQCFSCKMHIFKWNHNDDVAGEHLRLSPYCPFLTRQYTTNIPLDCKRLEEILPSSIPGFSLSLSPFTTTKKCFTFVDNILINACSPLKLMPPIYFCLRDEVERRRTLKAHKKLSLYCDSIATSGLFYSTLENALKCFSCGVKYKQFNNFQEIVSLLQMHEASKCSFVKKKLDEKKPVPIDDADDDTDDPNVCKICYTATITAAFLPCLRNYYPLQYVFKHSL